MKIIIDININTKIKTTLLLHVFGTNNCLKISVYEMQILVASVSDHDWQSSLILKSLLTTRTTHIEFMVAVMQQVINVLIKKREK